MVKLTWYSESTLRYSEAISSQTSVYVHLTLLFISYSNNIKYKVEKTLFKKDKQLLLSVEIWKVNKFKSKLSL